MRQDDLAEPPRVTNHPDPATGRKYYYLIQYSAKIWIAAQPTFSSEYHMYQDDEDPAHSLPLYATVTNPVSHPWDLQGLKYPTGCFSRSAQICTIHSQKKLYEK